MAFEQPVSRRRTVVALVGLALALTALPRPAAAQFEPQQARPAIGERYHVEVAGTLWNPALAGTVSSSQFGRLGDQIDFVSDLQFEQTRFRDLRFVVRPGRKHRFRFQYTPIVYTSETVFQRPIEFNGQRFDVSLPVASEFEWKVWRLGYEYDVYYTPRGFIGILFDVRQTRLYARLASPAADEFTRAQAPLPAIGIVGRAYPIPELAINFEVSGFRLPDVDPEYQANYFDWDIHGTFNVSEYVGLQVGWRRLTTLLQIERDLGDVKFQGMWFGAALRY
jgi:hypothetical protein